MSRFDTGRRLKIAVWTGAALAWGTTTAMAAQRTADARAGQEENPVVPAQLVIEKVAATPIPTLPEGGLVILRFQPPPEVPQEVRTVRVQAPSQPPPATSGAPQPKSSGS